MAIEIHPTATIDVEDLEIGDGTVIGAYTRLQGSKIHLGRDSWIGAHAQIGGGSAWDPDAYLEAGDFFHLGDHGEVNIARGVNCGDEVGLGVGTRVFTHGAWLSELDGFPADFQGVTIQDRVWAPNAQINPGVWIASDIVVTPGSVVSTNFYEGHMLIGGNPSKIIKKDYPAHPLKKEKQAEIINKIADEAEGLIHGLVDTDIVRVTQKDEVEVVATHFDPPFLMLTVDEGIEEQPPTWVVFELGENKRIRGFRSETAEIIKNQLRRHGIRFRYSAKNDGDEYEPWG